MPDIFDEFMDELKRRSAGQSGASDRGPRRVGPDEPEHPPPPDDRGGDEPPRRMPRREVRPSGGGPGIRTWLIAGVVILAIFLLTSGIGLWTDVIWYQSVHFDAVFWTRLWAGSGLFVGGLVVTLVV